jgi:hypothetical protein
MTRRQAQKIKNERMQRVSDPSQIVTQLSSLLSLDPYHGEFNSILAAIQPLGKEDRNRLLSICEGAFQDVSIRKDESATVACVKVIVALVPDSTNSIKKWINTSSGKYIYEVHFSLFCFLDDVPDLPNGQQFAKEIPLIIENYLMNIKTEAAHAAFMAGDLLGDHWEENEAFPILMKIAKEARYSVGRGSALWGLGQILHSLPDSDRKSKSIITLIQKISKNDRSEGVRASARSILDRKIL